ncbi:hypothetical protein TgHK011_003738 [Trichoderma gracile]|nr:hypothetical protein TgHK011_003738 [Trichoderma gracile]
MTLMPFTYPSSQWTEDTVQAHCGGGGMAGRAEPGKSRGAARICWSTSGLVDFCSGYVATAWRGDGLSPVGGGFLYSSLTGTTTEVERRFVNQRAASSSSCSSRTLFIPLTITSPPNPDSGPPDDSQQKGGEALRTSLCLSRFSGPHFALPLSELLLELLRAKTGRSATGAWWKQQTDVNWLSSIKRVQLLICYQIWQKSSYCL